MRTMTLEDVVEMLHPYEARQWSNGAHRRVLEEAIHERDRLRHYRDNLEDDGVYDCDECDSGYYVRPYIVAKRTHRFIHLAPDDRWSSGFRLSRAELEAPEGGIYKRHRHFMLGRNLRPVLDQKVGAADQSVTRNERELRERSRNEQVYGYPLTNLEMENAMRIASLLRSQVAQTPTQAPTYWKHEGF